MLGQVGDPFLCTPPVRLEGHDIVTDLLDVGLFLLVDLVVGLALALIVVEVTVEELAPGVLAPPLCRGASPVLVEPDALQLGRTLDPTAWGLLHLGVPLDVDLCLVFRLLFRVHTVLVGP